MRRLIVGGMVVSVMIGSVETVAFAQNENPAPAPADTAPAAPVPLQNSAAPSTAPAQTSEAKAEPAAAGTWYDKLSAEGFVDVYGSLNYNFPKPQTVTAAGGGNRFRAYDVTQGFALHWAGINASYAADPIGGTVSLRFGPGATLYNSPTDNNFGLTYVKQAYATFKVPGLGGKLTLDFGKYDQPFGSEVADSQYNMNYTRSVLYWYSQPLFFTGLRADYAVNDMVDVKVFAVNGWNNSVDNNRGKSFGAQVSIKPAESFLAILGYMGGPEQADTAEVICAPGTVLTPGTGTCAPSPGAVGGTFADHVPGANSRWRHIVDLVLDINPTKAFRALLNFDYDTEETPAKQVSWYGGNLALGYIFTDLFAASLRGELFKDPDGFALGTGLDTTVVDGTLTLAFTPSSHFMVKLDNRIDVANEEFFQTSISGTSKTQFTTTLGVVATTK